MQVNNGNTQKEGTMVSAHSKTYQTACVGMFVALLAICSWISIPMTVPFTLQTFGVIMAVEVLGGKLGLICVLVYLLTGAIGIPVFAHFTGGAGILLGSTGGYLIGFFFTALMMWAVQALLGKGLAARIMGVVLGLAVCYAFGTVWFIRVYGQANGAVSIATALGWCVVPFIVPDLCKGALALVIAPRIKRASGLGQ